MITDYRGIMPEIDPTAFIAENASVVGKVKIGGESSVWFGAVIRGDESEIRIGNGTSIQDNVVLHCDFDSPMDIGSNVTVGHGAIVHGAVIGDDTLIGMGAIILNGAHIGSCCIIGAGAVVKENAVIPDGSLVVGIPGKIVREVTPEQRALLKKGSYYVALSRDYMNKD